MGAHLGILLTLLLASGCTTAGPFVTSISSDGRGNLVIEKSMVEFNSFTGAVSNKNSTTTTLRFFDLAAIERATPMQTAPQQPVQAPVWTGQR